MTDGRKKLSLEELSSLLQSGADTGLSQVCQNAVRASNEVHLYYQQTAEAYKNIEQDLRDIDADKAHYHAEIAFNNLDKFLKNFFPEDREEAPLYQKGLLSAEVREKLYGLRRIKSALAGKKKLFEVYLDTIAMLEISKTRKVAESGGHFNLEERKQMLYFRKFIADDPENHLRQVLRILKQEGMYLPETRLVAKLNIHLGQPEETERIQQLLFQQKEKAGETVNYWEDCPAFSEDENYYFLTGTYCSIGKEIILRNYLYCDPHYSALRINTSHAPKMQTNEEKITRDLPLMGKIPLLSGERPVLYEALIGEKKDKFHELQYRLQQGIVVMRLRENHKKLWYEVATQNPNQLMARFFYGATTDRDKIVAYLLKGSEEIDREYRVEFPDLL